MKVSEEFVEIEFVEEFAPLVEIKKRCKIFHGGRSGAKSWQFAIAILGKGRIEKLFILCAREIQKSIKNSVYRLLCNIIIKYELNDYLIKSDSIININTGTEIIFHGLYRNIDNIKSVEGVDICWVEEGQSVSMESWNILFPTIRKEGSEIWVSMNRFLVNDPIWAKRCKVQRDDTLVVKVNYCNNPFFTDVSRAEMEQDKIDNYEAYLHIWEGEPMGENAMVAIKRRDLQIAIRNKLPLTNEIPEIGIDVARFGDDKTVFVKRAGLKFIDYRVYHHQKVDVIACEAMDFAVDKEVVIKVDDTGVGGGVTDILDTNGHEVIPVNFGANAMNEKKYANTITEMYFEFNKIVTNCDLPEVPMEIMEELADRLYTYDNKQRKIIEPKRDFKKRIGKSPDYGDATLLSFYNVDDSGYLEQLDQEVY